MKFILLSFLVFPFLASAQEFTLMPCELDRETDPYTKETVLSTGFFSLDNASVDIIATKSEIDVFFSITGSDKCYDNNSTALIYLEGSKVKLTARNGGTMNCDGYFHFIFKNSATAPSLLQKMMNQNVSQIIFTGNNKKETVITLGKDQQKFRDLLNCLVTEARKMPR